MIKNRKSIGFHGSNTHIFGIVYPPLILAVLVTLDRIGWVKSYEVSVEFALELIALPVVVAMVLFVIINKGIHEK
jgi:hypothetical protein